MILNYLRSQMFLSHKPIGIYLIDILSSHVFMNIKMILAQITEEKNNISKHLKTKILTYKY